MLRWIVLLFSIITCLNAKPSNNLTSLDDNGIQKWEPKVFFGKTIYSIDDHKGRLALQAIS
ncbi:MAG: hypothetical protein ACI8UG_001260 [Gammaproteobacteria bacterium]|jgi:hypothetical protein